MTWTQWIVTLVISGIVFPTVGWLVFEVLSLRRDMVRLQTEWVKITKDCERHQHWAEERGRTVNRLDRNIVRLCQHAKVDYEQE